MFRRCPKAFHNNYNCINHIGVIYSQYPFGDTLSKKPASYRNRPTNLQCKSTDWSEWPGTDWSDLLIWEISSAVIFLFPIR